jgi:hypothetical protein
MFSEYSPKLLQEFINTIKKGTTSVKEYKIKKAKTTP